MPKPIEAKTIELWEGYEVKVDRQLLDDFDFIAELREAIATDNLGLFVEMYCALIGGENTYIDIRAHIEADRGYFSQEALLDILGKVEAILPNSGNRAQRRSWKNTR